VLSFFSHFVFVLLTFIFGIAAIAFTNGIRDSIETFKDLGCSNAQNNKNIKDLYNTFGEDMDSLNKGFVAITGLQFGLEIIVVFSLWCGMVSNRRRLFT
jgi:hypothetical protein